MSSAGATLLAAVAEALHGDDAEAGLSAAMALLADAGFAAPSGSGAPPGLEARSHGQTIALSCPAGASDELRAGIAALLRLGLAGVANQQAFRTLHERMEMLSAASFEGILIHVDGEVIDANLRVGEMLRCEPSQLLGSGAMARHVAPEDLPAVAARVASGFEGVYLATGVRTDGTRFRAEFQSKQAKLGAIPVRVVAVRDVSDRERALSLVQEGERHLRDLARAAFDFMVVTRRTVVVDVDGGFERILGFTREKLVGRPAIEFVAPSEYASVSERLAAGRSGAYESTLIDAHGTEIPVQVFAVATTHGGEPARVAGFRDLRDARRLESERRKLEQQLERAQRLDSLGVLAGGIAHDFNNLLVGILGNASLLAEKLTDPFERETAQAIVTAGQRAATLTHQLLAYAGRQDLRSREAIDIGQLFEELRVLLSAALSKKASLSSNIEPSCAVWGDRSTLTQVMMNLVTNASDALEGRPGHIEFRARSVRELDARWDDALGASVGPGHWVLVEVQDDGVGMDEATKERVFEPFFTTKEHGHGLGLAACLGIVAGHGGALLVDSSPGKGSCFSVALPAAPAVGAATEKGLPGILAAPCRVLVIDDEPMVRALIRRILELRGYHVDEAGDGLSGVAAVERSRPDVIILDLTMGDMDGVDVVLTIRASGSNVPIVLSSGYQAHAAADRLPPGSFQGFLAKPYGAGELVAVLDRAREARRSSD